MEGEKSLNTMDDQTQPNAASSPVAETTEAGSAEGVALVEEDDAVLEEVANIARDEESGGQRPVSVIFASISGFETIPRMTQDEIEEVAIRKSGFDSALGDIISKYGGTTDKIIRGFFMATFGTQQARELDPVLAVISAYEMAEAAEQFGAEVHVGVNTGNAWVGQIRTERTIDTTVIGDAVNLAARLKTKAGHNEVVVSPDVYETSKEYFQYEPLRIIQPGEMKGISRPLQIYAVRGRTEKAAEIQATREGDAERLARLEEAIPEYLREKIRRQSPLPGERKLVTMLYSDVSGFTALSEKFKTQPQLIAEVMNRCHKRLGDVIYKHEGVIDKIVGDELMAIFGAPIVHEDDPERSIWCALEMMTEMARFSKEVEEDLGVPPLTVHIGITTGTVTIGNLIPGTARMDYTAIGETTELAEVLEDVSEGGQIVVAERTYRLTRALIDYEPLPPVQIHDKAVPIYLVVGKKDITESKRGLKELGDTPMIGREAQFAQSRRCLERLIAGEGRVVIVIGEAGFGKSRLKRETRTILEERGGGWIEGTCFSNTQNASYSVFLRAFETYLGLKENDPQEVRRAKVETRLSELFDGDENAISEVLPYIGNMLSIAFEGAYAERIRYLEPEQLRRRTFEAVRHLFAREASRRPLIVALDDLHWLDNLSNDLIYYLLEMVRDTGVLFMLIYRPERRDLCWQIGEIAAKKYEGHFEEIDILPLEPEAARALLDLMLPMREEGEPLKQLLLEKAGGNPFYLEEFIRVLLDDDFIEQSADVWTLKKDIHDFRVPDTLEQMLSARIDKLNDEAKVVLQSAAVVGRHFERVVIENVVDDKSHLDDELLHLTDLSFIREEKRDPLEYAFGHIVTFQISYDAIVSTRRRELHRRVGNTVERQHPDALERYLELLAFHYYQSTDRHKGVHYQARAGSKARRLFNNKDALTFYEQGLSAAELLPDADRDDLFEILLGLGDVYTTLGRFDDAIQTLSRALEMARAPLQQAVLLRKLGFVHFRRADWENANDHYERALRVLTSGAGTLDEKVEEARIRDLQGVATFNQGRLPEAGERHLTALDLVKDTDALDVLCSAYKNLGNVHSRLGKMDEAMNYYTQAIEIAERIGDKMLMSQMYSNLSETHRMQGRTDEAIESTQKAVALNEQMGYAEGLNATYLALGALMRQKQDMEQARLYYEKALEIAEQIGAPSRLAQTEIMLGSYYVFLRDYDAGIQHYSRGLELARSAGLRQGQALALVNLCDAYISKGDLEHAEQYGREAEVLAKELKILVFIVKVTINLGDITRKQGRYEEALRHYREALDFAVQARNVPNQAEIYRNIGDVYLSLNQPERAAGHLTKAAELYSQLGDTKQADEIRARISS